LTLSGGQAPPTRAFAGAGGQKRGQKRGAGADARADEAVEPVK
jgi:hypothetical protein